MNEEQLKALIGEAAFNAMSAEQRAALMGKFKPAADDPNKAVMEAINAIKAEVAALKPQKTDDGDPLLDKVQKDKKAAAERKALEEQISAATLFNDKFDTFLKEYAGILPEDVNELPKAASETDYPDKIKRANALKSSLVTSFFKEEANKKLLSESQNARLKAWLTLGKDARAEEAHSIYESIFEPTINHARSIRQAQLKQNSADTKFAGSKDSDIVMHKVHSKQIRNLMGAHKLNDVLHEQAKSLGLVKDGEA